MARDINLIVLICYKYYNFYITVILVNTDKHTVTM